jgi:8-oxo-dGTP pyrophosphatase MutT (NUDIX family)
MDPKIMYCNNCGERGHVFRTCPCPIISCGLILLRGTEEPLTLPADPSDIEVLMVRRKDSISYMEFLRGKYDLTNAGYIHNLIQNMTKDEQRRVVENQFHILWSALWGNSRDTNSPEYLESKEKFDTLDRARLVYEYSSKYEEPEWGFPKGRRMRKESDVDCAIREFFEETNISRDAYTLCRNLQFTETFKGTNGVSYKHIYFIGLLSHEIDVEQKLTPIQRREISQVGWKTFDECRELVRPYYNKRKELFTEIESAIRTFETLV